MIINFIGGIFIIYMTFEEGLNDNGDENTTSNEDEEENMKTWPAHRVP